ncbi:uncharacterized protein EKO05_0005119 [Ascochyta rabiei]|uniref:uncharacterized protein n=1 Tax=Didymella rabiei TaxID=5454 RepID=UPI0022087B11|nr:uncharacterized protein EKO05_0005119 [Ascochyta rabiei]UPX14642.1 hypothetical protein EKO05_0005119 [Ascochyta rabiei]
MDVVSRGVRCMSSLLPTCLSCTLVWCGCGWAWKVRHATRSSSTRDAICKRTPSKNPVSKQSLITSATASLTMACDSFMRTSAQFVSPENVSSAGMYCYTILYCVVLEFRFHVVESPRVCGLYIDDQSEANETRTNRHTMTPSIRLRTGKNFH